MASLETEFLGVTFDNPFFIGSASPTLSGKHLQKIIDKGWGSFVVKTLSVDKNVRPDVRPRLASVRKNGTLSGLQNCELITTHHLDWWERELKPIQETGAPFITSIMATPDLDDWAFMGRWAEEHGASIVELNVSCPHGCPEEHMGMFIGQDPQLVHDVTKAVKDEVSIPVMTKLTPNVMDITQVGKAAEKGGADALAAINTVAGIIDVDIYNATAAPFVLGKGTIAGNSGPQVRPIGLRIIAELAEAVNIPLSGIGGIDSWYNAIEYIMLGAKTTQNVTAAMWYGFGIVEKWKNKTLSFMEEEGFETIDDMVGAALDAVSSYEALEVEDHLYPEVDDGKCLHCNRCKVACADTGGGAIKVPKINDINDEECLGCALCAVVCPVNAIEMVVRGESRRWTREEGPPQ
jgi:dihydropyrimidine dehydrogenase (NAD+) subunit PreA